MEIKKDSVEEYISETMHELKMWSILLDLDLLDKTDKDDLDKVVNAVTLNHKNKTKPAKAAMITACILKYGLDNPKSSMAITVLDHFSYGEGSKLCFVSKEHVWSYMVSIMRPVDSESLAGTIKDAYIAEVIFPTIFKALAMANGVQR